MHLLPQTPEVIQISLAAAIALSTKFGGCALPILEEGMVVPKSANTLNDGHIDQVEIARAKAEIEQSYNAAASSADKHVPSPLETLQNLLHVKASKFFTLEIVR